MDEILASIRRIISDDAPAPGGQTLVEEEPPLLLTERVDPLPPEAPKPMPTEPTPSEKMTVVHHHADEQAKAAPDAAWIGEAAAADATGAFDRLSLMNSTPPAPTDPIAMPGPGRSLEDVTRELLRPMIKTWLDENLPRIVQDRVDEEVERLARRRVR